MPDQGYPRTSPLQIFPKGLLGLLQLKNGGEMPQRLLSEGLQPELDLLAWYMESNDEQLAVTFGAGLGNGFTSPAGFTVPARELWYVSKYAVIAGTNAAAVTRLQLQAAIRRNIPGVSTSIFVGEPGTNVVGHATDFVVASATINRGIFLGPGDQLGVYVLQLTAGQNPIADFQASITRLPI